MSRVRSLGGSVEVIPNPAIVRVVSPVPQRLTITGPVATPLTQQTLVVDRPEAVKVGDLYEAQVIGEVLSVTAVDPQTGAVTFTRNAWDGTLVPLGTGGALVPLLPKVVAQNSALELRFDQPVVRGSAPCDWWLRYFDAAINRYVQIIVPAVTLSIDGKGAQVALSEAVMQGGRAWFGIPERSEYLKSRAEGHLEAVNISVLAAP